jgi:hypothetical protein
MRTFEEWANSIDWWKHDAPEALRPIYNALIKAKYPVDVVETMLEHAIAALRAEYGEQHTL